MNRPVLGASAMLPPQGPIGRQLRLWRQRRRLSQLALACAAEISCRHLSFLETGRANPSREMILRLAEQLAVPARDQNALLLAGGYAPVFMEYPLEDARLRAQREALDRILSSHKPYPAFALDRQWRAVASNGALPALYKDVAPELLRQPVNVLRLSLHPNGLAPRIANLAEWRHHLLARLSEQAERTGDPQLSDLLAELEQFPAPAVEAPSRANPKQDHPVVPLELESDAGRLTFFTTTMVFGAPQEVTLSELAVEFFFPADEATAARARSLSRADPSG